MAFNAGTILAQLKLNSKGFTANLGEAQRSLGSFGGSLLKVQNLVRGSFAAALAIGTFKLADLGGRAIDSERAFNRLALQAGTTGDKVTEEVRKITGALTSQQIQRAGNTMHIMGLGIENLPRFLEVARAASIAFGKDVGFMLESIALGTARQSRLILDNLGIIVSADTAYAKYAASIGKAIDQLTEADKKQAFVNEVMFQGQAIINQVGGNASSAAEATQALAASMSDLRTELAGVVALSLQKPFAGMAGNARRLTSAISDLVDSPGWKNLLRVLPIGQLLERLGVIGPDETAQRVPVKSANAMPFGPFGVAGIPGGLPDTVFDRLNAMRAADRERLQSSGFGPRIPAGAGERPFDFMGPVLDPGLQQSTEAMELLNSHFETSGTLISNMASGMETFGMAIGRGERGAQAFGAAMIGAIGNFTTAMGDFFIQSGRGMIGLIGLNPFLTIAAGFALKTVAGIMRGFGTTISTTQGLSTFGGGGITAPDPTQTTGRGMTTIHVYGDFMDNPAVIDRLAEYLRAAQRDRNVEVVFNG